NWSKWRKDYFIEILESEGYFCHLHTFPINLKKNWTKELKKLELWLSNLPKPIGVFAAYDQLGRLIIESSNKSGFLVPEEIAVIGVDNDPLICELCSPSLTSIILDSYSTGYRAAELLNALMDGKRDEKIKNLFAP